MTESTVIQALMFVALSLLTLCAVLAWLFVALYSRVRWWATREGRHLMKFTVAFALMLSLTLMFQVIQPKPLTQLVLSIALFGWVAWELAVRSWLHVQAYREVRELEKRGGLERQE